jgi:hypothetical protein
VKKLTTSGKVVTLFVLGAILALSSAEQLRAFTLIEIVYLPAVQLVASQSAEVKVSNISTNDLELIITTFGDGGNVLTQKTKTLLPHQTFTLLVNARNVGTSFHTVIGLSAANAAVADVMTFDKTTGQVIAILPGIKFDTN